MDMTIRKPKIFLDLNAEPNDILEDDTDVDDSQQDLNYDIIVPNYKNIINYEYITSPQKIKTRMLSIIEDEIVDGNSRFFAEEKEEEDLFVATIGEKVKRRRGNKEEIKINTRKERKKQKTKELLKERSRTEEKEDDDSNVPDYYDRGNEKGFPLRYLEDFIFLDEEDIFSGLEDLEKMRLHGTGKVKLPSKYHSTGIQNTFSVKFQVDEWAIEYGEITALWIKSLYSWYRLDKSDPSYEDTFQPMERRFKLCKAVYEKLLSNLKISHEDMVNKLNNLGISDSMLKRNSKFLLDQMEQQFLDINRIPFLKTLKEMKRSE